MTNIEPQKTLITQFSPLSKTDESSACLVRIYPHSIGEGIINLSQDTTCIGRSKDSHIHLADLAVSRQHAQIEYHDNQFILSDLNSSNCTFINDKKIQKNPLSSGDLIRIGHTIFKFLSCGHIEKQYHEVIYSMMIRDGLTNIPNKRYFLEMLDREVTRSQRHQRPLSLVIFDVDHFKSINDRFGHLTGDMILRDLCQRIQCYIRTDEVFARYGGEEFIILLPETNLKQAWHFAKKILTAISDKNFSIEPFDIPLTISIGIAELHLKQKMTAEQLIERADTMLYKAKNSGRNCIIVD